jgi:hypothetical protein
MTKYQLVMSSACGELAIRHAVSRCNLMASKIFQRDLTLFRNKSNFGFDGEMNSFAGIEALYRSEQLK